MGVIRFSFDEDKIYDDLRSYEPGLVNSDSSLFLDSVETSSNFISRFASVENMRNWAEGECLHAEDVVKLFNSNWVDKVFEWESFEDTLTFTNNPKPHCSCVIKHYTSTGKKYVKNPNPYVKSTGTECCRWYLTRIYEGLKVKQSFFDEYITNERCALRFYKQSYNNTLKLSYAYGSYTDTFIANFNEFKKPHYFRSNVLSLFGSFIGNTNTTDDKIGYYNKFSVSDGTPYYYRGSYGKNYLIFSSYGSTGFDISNEKIVLNLGIHFLTINIINIGNGKVYATTIPLEKNIIIDSSDSRYLTILNAIKHNEQNFLYIDLAVNNGFDLRITVNETTVRFNENDRILLLGRYPYTYMATYQQIINHLIQNTSGSEQLYTWFELGKNYIQGTNKPNTTILSSSLKEFIYVRNNPTNVWYKDVVVSLNDDYIFKEGGFAVGKLSESQIAYFRENGFVSLVSTYNQQRPYAITNLKEVKEPLTLDIEYSDKGQTSHLEFQLSPDGENWYICNGSSWVLASNPRSGMLLNHLNNVLSIWPHSTLAFKIIFVSDGKSPLGIDNMSLNLKEYADDHKAFKFLIPYHANGDGYPYRRFIKFNVPAFFTKRFKTIKFSLVFEGLLEKTIKFFVKLLNWKFIDRLKYKKVEYDSEGLKNEPEYRSEK